MIRKLSNLILSISIIILLASCQSKTTLLFLNWGEYVDEELLAEFEAEYNCNVVMDLAESNESFYAKVKSGTTVYDVICPSDYMVIKMYNNDLLAEIDFSKLTNYSYDNLLPGTKGIVSAMEAQASGISKYAVPYLWGTWGIMYSTNKDGLEEAILNNDSWSILFNRDTLPEDTKLAMYDSSLHAYYAACKYLNLDTTAQLDDKDLNKIYNCIKEVNFDAWGTDDIKKKITAGNLDLGFMWTGDFLYYYCEKIVSLVMDAYNLNPNININEMINSLISTGEYLDYQIGFDLYIPDDTIAFCDNLVITKKAAHKDLAHEFINFMCMKKSAYANSYYVMYDTPFVDVYDQIVDLKLNELVDITEDNVYDLATGYAYEKYYPKTVNNLTGYKGNILTAFDRKYINKINAVFNNSKV